MYLVDMVDTCCSVVIYVSRGSLKMLLVMNMNGMWQQ